MRHFLSLFACFQLVSGSAFAAHGCHGGGHGHGGHGHPGHSYPGHGGHSAANYTPPIPYDGCWDHFGGKLSLRSAPSRLFDTQGGMLPLGIEYYLTSNLSVSADWYLPLKTIALGGGAPGKEDYVQITDDRRYSLELRQYIAKSNTGRAFIGEELFYRKQVAGIDSGGYVQDGNMYSYGHATVSKESTGLGAFIGYNFYVWSGLMMEVYAGVGLRLHTTWQDDIVRLRDDGADTCDCRSRPDNNIVGTKASVYVPIGLRFTWTLGKMPK